MIVGGKAVKGCDLRKWCQKLTLTAINESEAKLLACIYVVFAMNGRIEVETVDGLAIYGEVTKEMRAARTKSRRKKLPKAKDCVECGALLPEGSLEAGVCDRCLQA